MNALKVANHLVNSGFEAYLVGGSVRDLLLHKAPKDFDVATNATPTEIKRLFKNGRIIGRRFKLVHILFHREIIEVATFRGHDVLDANQQTNERGMLIRDNTYGNLEEDAWRRDLTINSLYYHVKDSSILDFTGGVNDVKQKLIRIIGDPKTRYQEDPVRMLRVIRFAAKLRFNISPETAAPLAEMAHLITHISNSRLFDEVTKMYQCGEAKKLQELLITHRLFDYLFPLTAATLSSEYPVHELLNIALENTDTRIHEEKPVTPAFVFAVLLWFPMLERSKIVQATGLDPLPSLEKAMSLVLAEQSRLISIPKRFTQVIREIWLLQYRFNKRLGERAYNLLRHPRFRAAYDFMALRALAGDESIELAEWWNTFQDVDPEEQAQMISKLQTKKKSPKN